MCTVNIVVGKPAGEGEQERATNLEYGLLNGYILRAVELTERYDHGQTERNGKAGNEMPFAEESIHGAKVGRGHAPGKAGRMKRTKSRLNGITIRCRNLHHGWNCRPRRSRVASRRRSR